MDLCVLAGSLQVLSFGHGCPVTCKWKGEKTNNFHFQDANRDAQLRVNGRGEKTNNFHCQDADGTPLTLISIGLNEKCGLRNFFCLVFYLSED